jgi:hypothetical protein
MGGIGGKATLAFPGDNGEPICKDAASFSRRQRQMKANKVFLIGAMLAALALVGFGGRDAVAQTPPPPAPPGVIYLPSPPPAEVVEVQPPPPDRRPIWAWHRGHWRWDGRQYAWQPGHWVERPPHMAEWVPPHWERHPNGWFLVEGHWR